MTALEQYRAHTIAVATRRAARGHTLAAIADSLHYPPDLLAARLGQWGQGELLERIRSNT